MATKREINALVPVLTDPENTERTPEEVAELAIAALDECRARHNRLAVVAQFSWGLERPHTVVLGPFSTRALSAAREAGGRLAAPGQHPGHGRFMLVPAYSTAKAAWDAHKPVDEVTAKRMERLAGQVARWAPGLWAHEMNTGPVCRCGRRRRDPRDTGLCPVHREETG